MAIQIHNTLTRELEPLRPLTEGEVRLYVCGPTVYDDCHIGHLMGPVVFDTVARWLTARGYRVRFVNNITDIDDKIIRRALDTGEAWDAISERYTQQYLGFLEELGVTTITDHPRCTEYVDGMVRFTQELIDAGRAYAAPDGVYYRVERQPGYGKLSGRKLEDMQAGSRVAAEEGLENPADFALWKKAKPGEPTWPSPWGDGRPGWHIECSVMSSALLGGAFDIHGGGDDLKFPHHENEIAQSEAHGDAFATLWMHNGLVQYGGRKVAKSDPRMQDPEFRLQFQARWLLDTYGAPAVRFFLTRSPYRRPVDFEPSTLAGARTGLMRLYKQLGERMEAPEAASLEDVLARDLPEGLAARRAAFCAAMDHDFNTGEAVAQLFALASDARDLEGEAATQALDLCCDLGRLIGYFQPGDAARVAGAGSGDERLGGVVEGLLRARGEARARKDFASGDALRDLLTGSGVQVLDSSEGSAWEPAAEGARFEALLDGVVALRDRARAEKDWTLSDALRDALQEAGVQVLDGPEGTAWQLG